MADGPDDPALRVVVLADTHLRTPTPGGPGRARDLTAEAWRLVEQADVLLHAGDVLDAGVLGRLAEHAPVHAVLGNNDTALIGRLPRERVVEVGGVRIGMIHDSGPATGRARRLRRRFPDAAVVVFGHSHTPVDEEGEEGQRLFNPGSPTERRRQPYRTIGELRIRAGSVIEHRIIELDRPDGVR